MLEELTEVRVKDEPMLCFCKNNQVITAVCDTLGGILSKI